MPAALIFTALLVAHVDAMSARPAPCSVGLAKFERQIAYSKSDRPARGTDRRTNGRGPAPTPADIGRSEEC
jgi:hypothetical protein